MSVLFRPMSWKLSSVNFQPLWHLLHSALVLKSMKPRLALSRDRFLVALDPGVERRAARNDGALIGGDRPGDGLRVMPLPGKAASNSGLYSPMLFSRFSSSSIGRFISTSAWIGSERLLLQRAGAAVPHEDLAVGGVDDRRRAALERLHLMADADRLAVAPAVARAMAGGAREQVRLRKAGCRNRASCRAPPFGGVGLSWGTE